VGLFAYLLMHHAPVLCHLLGLVPFVGGGFFYMNGGIVPMCSSVLAGAGSDPLPLTGAMYLTAPEPGAVAGAVLVTHAQIGELEAPVRAALVMTPARLSELVVEQCAAAGVEWIWLHRGVGVGSVSSGAVAGWPALRAGASRNGLCLQM